MIISGGVFGDKVNLINRLKLLEKQADHNHKPVDIFPFAIRRTDATSKITWNEILHNCLRQANIPIYLWCFFLVLLTFNMFGKSLLFSKFSACIPLINSRFEINRQICPSNAFFCPTILSLIPF